MSNDYQKIVCTITDSECYKSDCDGCSTADRQKDVDEEERINTFNFGKESKINGHIYQCNYRYTIMKFTLDRLPEVITDLKLANPIEISSIDDEYLEEHYTEWVETKKLHGITEIPHHYVFDDDKHPLIIIFQEIGYAVAPRLMS